MNYIAEVQTKSRSGQDLAFFCGEARHGSENELAAWSARDLDAEHISYRGILVRARLEIEHCAEFVRALNWLRYKSFTQPISLLPVRLIFERLSVVRNASSMQWAICSSLGTQTAH